MLDPLDYDDDEPPETCCGRLCDFFRWLLDASRASLKRIWNRWSVFLEAFFCAFPPTVLAVLLRAGINGNGAFLEDIGIDLYLQETQVWNAFSGALFLVISFRTSMAYGRYWEGATLLHQMRAEWLDASSTVIAFSKSAPSRISMNEFQHVLIRLMSFLHGAALHEIKDLGNEDFDVIDIQNLDDASIEYLKYCKDTNINRVEVVLHWIQVLITDNIENGVITVPAPIITRVYQTLSRGMVDLHNCRKISDVPFPRPFSQMISFMLVLYTFFIPMVIATVVESLHFAAIVAFVPNFGLWAINLTAMQMEQPFGSDYNDLPLHKMQKDFNSSLLTLIDVRAQQAPHLKIKPRSASKGASMLLSIRRKGSTTDFLTIMESQKAAQPEAAISNLASSMENIRAKVRRPSYLGRRRQRRPSEVSLASNGSDMGSPKSEDHPGPDEANAVQELEESLPVASGMNSPAMSTRRKNLDPGSRESARSMDSGQSMAGGFNVEGMDDGTLFIDGDMEAPIWGRPHWESTCTIETPQPLQQLDLPQDQRSPSKSQSRSPGRCEDKDPSFAGGEPPNLNGKLRSLPRPPLSEEPDPGDKNMAPWEDHNGGKTPGDVISNM